MTRLQAFVRKSVSARSAFFALVVLGAVALPGCKLSDVLRTAQSQNPAPASNPVPTPSANPSPAPTQPPSTDPRLCADGTRSDQRCCSGGMVPEWWCPADLLDERKGGCSVTASGARYPASLFTCVAPTNVDASVTLTPYAKSNRTKPFNHWDPEWTYIVRAAVPVGMLGDEVPSDVKDVCPKFFSMSEKQKREFWAYFLQAMSVAESALNRSTRYREVGIPGNDSVTGAPIWSEGLLQLSYQDAKIYKCDFDWKTDRALAATDVRKTIFDAKRNLECGLTILNRQIIVRKNPLFPPKNWYWAVLTKRDDNAGYKRLMAQMANVPSFCR